MRRPLTAKSPDFAPLLDTASESVSLPDVVLAGNVVRIANHAARTEEAKFVELNLDHFWLPASPINDQPIPLSSRPDLVSAALRCVAAIAGRTPSSKSKSQRLSGGLRTFILVFEYGWLQGLYTLNDYSARVTTKLLQELGTGGWAHALKVESRTVAFSTTQPELASQMLVPSKNGKGKHSIREEAFGRALGTNCRGSLLVKAKKALLSSMLKSPSVIDPLTVRSEDGHARSPPLSAGYLKAILGAINLLRQCLPDGEGLRFTPYPDPGRLAEKFGRPDGRTSTLTPDLVGALLKESTFWIEEVADPALRLLDDIYAAIRDKAKGEKQKNVVLEALRASNHAARLEVIFESPISGISAPRKNAGTSLLDLTNGLVSACFIIIATFNARRKDELQHRKVGLHRGALRVVDRRIRLYECDFYVEKSYKDYVTFYVNDLTRKALRILEETSDFARDLESLRVRKKIRDADKEQKLFQLPRLIDGKSAAPTWFRFGTSYGCVSKKLIERALGKGARLTLRAHMFRRAYALIFHYRYENASLTALAQQLGHLDLERVRIYVSDAPGRSQSATATSFARKRSGEAIRSEFQRELDAEIYAVAIDRVKQIASAVAQEDCSAKGGFVRLVRRFHQRLGGRLDYSQLDHERQAQMLAERLIAQGHHFRPMPHANCVASSTRRNRGAGCFSQRLQRNAPETADAGTCITCPYSHFVAEHVDLWRKDLELLQAQSDGATLLGRNAGLQALNLRRAIKLVETRTPRPRGSNV